MNRQTIGTYLVDAGTLVGMIFKSAPMQAVSQFLVTLGIGFSQGQGTVGPITIGAETVTLTFSEKT